MIRVPEAALRVSQRKPTIGQGTGSGVNFDELRAVTDATLLGALGPDNTFVPTEIRVDADKFNALCGNPNALAAIFHRGPQSVPEAINILANALCRECRVQDPSTVELELEETRRQFSAPTLMLERDIDNIAGMAVSFPPFLRSAMVQPPTDGEILDIVLRAVTEYTKRFETSLSELAKPIGEGQFLLQVVEKVKVKLQEEKEARKQAQIAEVKLGARELILEFDKAKGKIDDVFPTTPDLAPKLRTVDSITLLSKRVLQLLEQHGEIEDRDKGHVTSIFQAIVAFAKELRIDLQEPSSLDNPERLIYWFNDLVAPLSNPGQIKKSFEGTDHPTVGIIGAALSCADPRLDKQQ